MEHKNKHDVKQRSDLKVTAETFKKYSDFVIIKLTN